MMKNNVRTAGVKRYAHGTKSTIFIKDEGSKVRIFISDTVEYFCKAKPNFVPIPYLQRHTVDPLAFIETS